MAGRPENLEWSLTVPSVKELARQRVESVPSRYIRVDVDHPRSPSSSNSIINPTLLSCVPLIDMSKLTDPESQEMELHKLQSACRDWGLFQLINHGVSNESLRNMKTKTQGFFDLPLQKKMLYEQKPGGLEGYGQHFVISEEQKLDWCDMMFLRTLPTQIRNLAFWPEHPPKYREAIESYSEEMRKVAVCIAGFIAKGLGINAEEVSKSFQDGKYELRLNCYPPCPQPEQVLGASSHVDVGGITLLLDCGDVPALQVLKDGQWVPVKPIADALVVNTGGILEIMTNGIYKAPYHRAIVDKGKERLSMAMFCYPNPNIEIGPATELIKAENKPLYKTLTHHEYLQSFFDWKLDDVPFIDTLKL